MVIQKNARCPNCTGILKKREGNKDIFISCTACNLRLKVTGLTEYDGEFVCEKISKEDSE